MNEMKTIDDEDLYLAEDSSYLYQDQPFTGVARHTSREGVLVSEIEYADGLQDGIARYWYPSGELLGEEHFRRNSRTGVSREWYRNGQLKRDTIFDYSIRVREKLWDERGQLVRDFILTEDKPLFRTLQDFRRIYRQKDVEQNG